MNYETSYDTGLKPFNHDKTRGKWSKPSDFLFACIGHAFKADAIIVMPAILFRELGIFSLAPYFLILGICVVPIVFMQSFLGQFSGTGFISVFRIAPLFKGIGYVSLAVNFLTLTYYSLFSAIPLFFLFHALRPTIPWSCEAASEWMELKENRTSACATNHTFEDYIQMEIPSVNFFRTHLNLFSNYTKSFPAPSFSWLLMLCMFLVWGMVTVVVLQPTEMIGRFMRYSCMTVIGIMGLCALRFLFLPGIFSGIHGFFSPFYLLSIDTWVLVPAIALSALGPGWGSVLTMASYNNFKTNIFNYSWILCLAQLGMILGLSFLSMAMTGFLRKGDSYLMGFNFIINQWTEFLIIPQGLTFIELPHFWSFVFFVMLILGSLNLLIVQLFSVLTSLFDEYEKLRTIKKEVTLGTVGVLAVLSIFFCTNHGVNFFELLTRFSMMTQMILNLLLLLVVLWIYGRERFQRDVNFMTSQIYSTWKINMLKYVAPLFLLLALLIGMGLGLEQLVNQYTWVLGLLSCLLILLPWCLIPSYCVFKILQTSGMLRMRFRRCVRPNDWYPADPLYRQRYEETFSSSEVSHQLTTQIEE